MNQQKKLEKILFLIVVKDRNGDTALTLAIRHKQKAVIEKLVSLGANALFIK